MVVSSCTTGSPIDLFVWVEWPSITSVTDAATFYDKLAAFVNKNCVDASVSRLVLRVLHPSFPSSSSLWWPPATSPLYTNLIQKIPSSVELVVYPYLMDQSSVSAWQAFSPGSNPVEAVWDFMTQWNAFLTLQGHRGFVGTAIDMEEASGLKSLTGTVIDASLVSSLKAKYGLLEFGVTAGFDSLGGVAGFDRVYLEMYDFYTPVVSADKLSTSPFLLNKDNPSAMVDFILNQVLTTELSGYDTHANEIFAMWSNQDLGSACIAPDNGRCGLNNEFGSWSGSSFNQFITLLKQRSPVMAKLRHGVFQFSYTPTAWLQ